ncbi:MAG: ATP-binding protein, partial [Gemmatimonadaceae bacterium]
GALLITRCATTRRALQREVERTQRVDSLGRFAGGIAHDFNNMLTVVLNCAQLGSRELPEGHIAREDFSQIEQVAKRSADLTRQLLAFAKRQPAATEALDVRQLFQESEALLRRLLGSAIELRIEIAPDAERVWFERSQFDQVIMNLAATARDAMPHSGRLSISVRTEIIPEDHTTAAMRMAAGDYVRIDVTDTGSGMTPAVALRVFEPFFTTKEDGLGTGLGLAVVYGAVTQHGGAVWLESQPGAGTTFHLLLRKPPFVPGPTHASTSVRHRVEGDGASILVVDDDGPLRGIAARLLRDRGYAVVEAADGLEALQAIDATPSRFRAVVTDLVMPQLGGAELTRTLIDRWPSIGIVIASGYPDALARVASGVVERCVMLQKPFDGDALAAAVQASIDLALGARV